VLDWRCGTEATGLQILWPGGLADLLRLLDHE